MMRMITNKKPVVIACIITMFLGYWSFYVEDRSPIEHLLTDETNWIVQGQKYVDDKKSELFAPTDPVLYLADTKKEGWSQTLCNFEEYTNTFGTVFGFCTTPYFYLERAFDPVLNDEIDVIHDEAPFIINGKPPDSWKEQLQKSIVMKSFAAHNLDYLLSVVFLPQSASELVQAERAVQIIQMGKEISWYRILDLDVHSLWYGITGTGWVIGRYLIHIMLIASTMLLAILGVGFILLICFRSVFGNWRLAWISVIHIWAALICQTGAMALLGIHRSVFTLLAQMIPFLMGTSAIPEVFEKRDHARKPLQWVAALDIISFATLVNKFLGFEVTHIQEFAYAGMLGAFFTAALALYSFPYFLRETDIARNVAKSWINEISTFLFNKFNKMSDWFSDGSRPLFAVTGILLFFFSTVWLVSDGQIKTETDSETYIKGTSVAKGLDILDSPGGPGQSLVEMLLECRGGRSFTDPSCAREMIAWHHAAEEDFTRNHPELRTTISMVKMYEEIAIGTKENPGIIARLPETEADIAIVWPSIKNRLSQLNKTGMPTYQSQLWCKNDNCFRVILGISIHTDAQLNKVITDLHAYNESHFPGLKTTFYGKNALYSQLGHYVTQGKVKNSFTSTIAVGITFFLFLLIIQRGYARSLSALKGGLISMIPFFFAPSVFLALLWISNGVLDVVAATISSFAIAAAGDFMVLLIYALIENIKKHSELSMHKVLELTLREDGPLRVRDMFMNVGAFSVFAFCVLFEPVQMLGIAMMLITFLCLFGALVFSMAILKWMLRPIEIPLETV